MLSLKYDMYPRLWLVNKPWRFIVSGYKTSAIFRNGALTYAIQDYEGRFRAGYVFSTQKRLEGSSLGGFRLYKCTMRMLYRGWLIHPLYGKRWAPTMGVDVGFSQHLFLPTGCRIKSRKHKKKRVVCFWSYSARAVSTLVATLRRIKGIHMYTGSGFEYYNWYCRTLLKTRLNASRFF